MTTRERQTADLADESRDWLITEWETLLAQFVDEHCSWLQPIWAVAWDAALPEIKASFGVRPLRLASRKAHGAELGLAGEDKDIAAAMEVINAALNPVTAALVLKLGRDMDAIEHQIRAAGRVAHLPSSLSAKLADVVLEHVRLEHVGSRLSELATVTVLSRGEMPYEIPAGDVHREEGRTINAETGCHGVILDYTKRLVFLRGDERHPDGNALNEQAANALAWLLAHDGRTCPHSMLSRAAGTSAGTSNPSHKAKWVLAEAIGDYDRFIDLHRGIGYRAIGDFRQYLLVGPPRAIVVHRRSLGVRSSKDGVGAPQD